MNVYAVVRTGVYDQGIFGIYEDFMTASSACKRAIALEPDSYHCFDIREYVLGDDLINERQDTRYGPGYHPKSYDWELS